MVSSDVHQAHQGSKSLMADHNHEVFASVVSADDKLPIFRPVNVLKSVFRCDLVTRSGEARVKVT
jgi:hypothetical protein